MKHLANLIANLNGAFLHKNLNCHASNTKLNKKVLFLLWVLGYIDGFYVLKNSFKLKINMRPHLKANIILISKPGSRCYCTLKDLKKLIKYKKATYILNTSRGLLTHKTCIY